MHLRGGGHRSTKKERRVIVCLMLSIQVITLRPAKIWLSPCPGINNLKKGCPMAKSCATANAYFFLSCSPYFFDSLSDMCHASSYLPVDVLSFLIKRMAIHFSSLQLSSPTPLFPQLLTYFVHHPHPQQLKSCTPKRKGRNAFKQYVLSTNTAPLPRTCLHIQTLSIS